MGDLRSFNRETKADREARKERAAQLTAGRRGPDGLTDLERMLLMRLRAQGLEVSTGRLQNSGGTFQHKRVVARRIS